MPRDRGHVNSFGGILLLGEPTPGTYVLTVGGWDKEQSADISYQVTMTLSSQNDNAPPLLSGPDRRRGLSRQSRPPLLPHLRDLSHLRHLSDPSTGCSRSTGC